MFNLIPFQGQANNLFDYFDNLDREFFGRGTQGVFPCRTDIVDQGDNYLLKAELPGFNKEEIQINTDGNLLTISAEHSEEKQEKEENFVRKERRYGSFSRSFNIEDIDDTQINARYTNGVLEVTLPKKQKVIPSARQIEVKAE